MTNEEYYQRIATHLEINTPLWQATVISTDGSTPARPGMRACIGKDPLYFGNLGGGEMEHSIIGYIRSNLPAKPITLDYDLSSPAEPINGRGKERITTAMICGGFASVFIEPLHRAETLFIVGGGHCGQALAQLAHLTGYCVVIIDNRQDVLDEAKRLVDVRTVLSDYRDIATIIPPQQAGIVIMTHGHVHDRAVLEQALELSPDYLGMIGSKRKIKETFDKMIGQGIAEENLARVHAPIGLTIGSQTPYEIAISIMAEIIAERTLARKKLT